MIVKNKQQDNGVALGKVKARSWAVRQFAGSKLELIDHFQLQTNTAVILQIKFFPQISVIIYTKNWRTDRTNLL